VPARPGAGRVRAGQDRGGAIEVAPVGDEEVGELVSDRVRARRDREGRLELRPFSNLDAVDRREIG